MAILSKSQSCRRASVCQNCKHNDLCRSVDLKQQDLRQTQWLFEDEVVLYHTLCLELEERGFSYPNSASFCDYADKDASELMYLMSRQDSLIHERQKKGTS